jgi:hypothetical protein
VGLNDVFIFNTHRDGGQRRTLDVYSKTKKKLELAKQPSFVASRRHKKKTKSSPYNIEASRRFFLSSLHRHGSIHDLIIMLMQSVTF